MCPTEFKGLYRKNLKHLLGNQNITLSINYEVEYLNAECYTSFYSKYILRWKLSVRKSAKNVLPNILVYKDIRMTVSVLFYCVFVQAV